MFRLFRDQRLRKAADFEKFRSGRAEVIYGGVFIVKVLRREVADGSVPRIGIVTSRRVGNAVRRNGIRRIIREIFRLNRGLFPDAHDYLFIALRGIGEKSRAELRRAVIGTLATAQRSKRHQSGGAGGT